MAHSLGGVACLIIKGIPSGPREVVEFWHDPGFNGFGAQKLGLGDTEFQLELLHIDTSANIDIWIAAVEALQGTLVSLIYDNTEWDKTYSNLLITKITQPVKKRVIYLNNTRTLAMFTVAGVDTSTS